MDNNFIEDFEKAKKYYDKVQHKKALQEFINLAYTLCAQHKIANYRLAIKGNEIMLIIGMRTVLNFKEEKETSFIGTIVKNDFLDKLSKIKYNLHAFGGSDNKSFITLNYTLFLEYKNDIITDIQAVILEELKAIKGHSKEFWNTTSTTTSVSFKHIVSQNILPKVYFNEKQGVFKNKPATLKNHSSKNQILYGPPGTGKTYVTKKLAVELIDKKKYSDTEEDRKIIIDRYNELHKKEQIVFTTFHQSMSYEDFVEGIKPKTEDKQVTYEVEDGIFKKLVTEACYSIAQETKKESLCKTLDFFGLYDSYLNTISERLEQEDTVELSTKSGGKVYITEVSQQGNFLVTHKNGTRSYTVSKERLSKLNKGIPNLTLISNIHDTFRKIIGGSNASVYWAVLNELHKQNKKQGKKYKNISEENIISYQDKLEIVNSLSNNDYSIGTKKPYVLIIDEINRGNVSAIFGELITLLEPDKRLGQSEAITVKLPYSKKEFGVPSNLHIIGTMNTADRSVESLDTALRRRFEFKEILPKPSLLKEILFDGFNLKDILETINNRIELLLDRDHTIGHSYFITIESGDTTKLATVFNNNVIPLLQEYFYGDYGKIGLVLGKGFIRKKENNKINFADFKYENSNDFKTPSFELEKIDTENIIDAIHKTLDIKTAVKLTEVKQVTPELANV
ncbi:McrB family protein [Tenacibaculum finnmarkense]|uniref:McrB family protein n=1 Tax=Tenacibaculum finnmarkense TaxID=2781243 RepID=UPI0023003BFF|nr:AAA family ATPase [Tenacibaculum finnmarkense]WCC48048.1 AAA family ATPase [Tenacibaculum finnmarkense]